jgi:paraquat-inducible protein A
MDSTTSLDRRGTLFVCHDCDALQRVPAVEPGHDALCMRCGSRLFRNPVSGIDKPLALIFASMILFVVANTNPVMSISILGVVQDASISDAALAFIHAGSPELAAIVWLPSVLIPGLTIVSLLYVLASIRFDLNWPGTKTLLVWISRMLPWGMMDVFLLGILVSLVKLAALADIALGTGFYAFLILIFLYAASIASLEPHSLWEQLGGDYERQFESEND